MRKRGRKKDKKIKLQARKVEEKGEEENEKRVE
jgi:hypothetical protein